MHSSTEFHVWAPAVFKARVKPVLEVDVAVHENVNNTGIDRRLKNS